MTNHFKSLRSVSAHIPSLVVRCIVALSLCLGVLSIAAIAQEAGQIAGKVTDSTGAIVPGVVVTATNAATNAPRTATTSDAGTFVFTGLAPGIYNVAVPATGGLGAYTGKAEVTVGGKLTLDIKLIPASSMQTVTVEGEGGVAVNTQNQEVSQVVTNQEVSQLPSLSRNPYDFVTIAGNISSGDKVTSSGATSTTGDQNDTTRGVGFSLNGQRSTGTEILLDGVENNDTYLTGPALIQIPIDSVQEYRVITSNFGPEYGRASGGVVNVVTKSGTNVFHGGAWEYNRLSAYTANTVTNAQAGIAKGDFTRNQFGFDIGGPIRKDKLFFFESTEWIRVRGAASNQSLIPTPQFLSLSASNTQDYFNAYGKNPPSYSSTLSKADVVAGGVTPTPGGPFDALPDSTPIFGVTAFQAPANAGGGNPQNTYYLVGRVDYFTSDKTQMYGRFALYDEIDQLGGLFSSPYSQYNVGEEIKGQTYLYGLTHEFSPVLVSTTKLSFTRNSTDQSYDTALGNTPVLYFKSGATFAGIQAQLPGFFDINEGTGGLPAAGPQNTSQINQDFDYTKGHHSIKVGAQLFYIQNNISYGAYAQAVEGLSSSLPGSLDAFMTGQLALFKAAANPAGAFPCYRNYSTGVLTITPGCSVDLPATQPSFARSNRYKEWAVYAQDSYKLTPRLVLNYGVRYDHLGVLHEADPSLQANFFPGPGSSVPAQVRSGQVLTTPNSPNGRPWNPQWGTVSPRVGFAYDVMGDGKTSIRGGYGISYERNFGNVTFNIIQNPPNYAVLTINNTPVTTSNLGPLGGSSGTVPLPPTSLRAVDPNIRVASTQFYSMTLERQISPGVVASIGYVGSRGIHLYDIKNYNQQGAGNVYLGDPITAPTAAANGYSRSNNQYSDINDRGSNGDSHYDGMNIGLQINNLNRTGFNLTANYTYAHSLDDISSTFSESNSASNGIGNLGYLNPFNPALDYGASDFDTRHRFVLAPIYQTPWYKGSTSAMGRLLGGYQLTGIYTVRTGTPFTYSDSTDSLNAGAGSGIPRYLPSTNVINKNFRKIVSQAGSNLYNIGNLPAASPYPLASLPYGGISDFGPYPAGMSHRNAFYGPGAWNIDLAVSKNIPITERVSLELRAEGFDIFNHHNLYALETINDVANFGYDPTLQTPQVIQGRKGGVNGGANDERRFGQFSGRITF
jgi:Carboxypeptidase regulatory-like domain/TonB dependent receptor